MNRMPRQFAQFSILNCVSRPLLLAYQAANYMDIKPLLDLTCAKVASMIKGRTPDEIRKIFNISSDFTPEEEIKVRADNPWLEEC